MVCGMQAGQRRKYPEWVCVLGTATTSGHSDSLGFAQKFACNGNRSQRAIQRRKVEELSPVNRSRRRDLE